MELLIINNMGSEYFDIGDFHKKITTNSNSAQLWFDRGLLNTYSFNHFAAIQCFKKTIEDDPDCAMGYWGIAYALGPHYNMMEITKEAFDEGLGYMKKALSMKDKLSGW
jgi:tetratricopeptide (TPR) repeat protein